MKRDCRRIFLSFKHQHQGVQQITKAKANCLLTTGHSWNYVNNQTCLRALMTQTARHTTPFSSSRFYLNEPINSEEAKRIVNKLTKKERLLLAEAIQKCDDQKKENESQGPAMLTSAQAKALFAINCTPFIGFGFFDNLIMICAGEYIDNTLGIIFGMSTMAAAAFGNLISDLAGVQLSIYIEAVCMRLGLTTPDLTPEQAELPRTNRIIAAGKLIGITVGCLIGMFPLLLIKTKKDEDDDEDEQDKKKE